MKYQYIENNESQDEVSELCDGLGVSRSGYYSWKNRIPCSRSLEDKMIKEKIIQINEKAAGYYGHRPIYHHLKEHGLSCGRDSTPKAVGTNSNNNFSKYF